MSEDTPPKTSEHRVLAVLLALAAVGCFAIAAFSSRWLYNERTKYTLDEVGFGLLDNFECRQSDGASVCKQLSNGELVESWQAEVAKARAAAGETAGNFRDSREMREAEIEKQIAIELKVASSAFAPLGKVTFVACLVSAASLLIATALVLARKRLVLPMMPTTLALLGILVALVAGPVFAALKPGPAGYVGVSSGFFLFGGGIVAGLASALMLNKLLRPVDPDLLSDAMNPDQF